tara:strand:+ start:280 stop:1653 length:1374 start_codon:yes stop_codon:yes gene_type:complete
MATFRTGADGRTVISDDNRVTVQAGDVDRGGFTARERAAGLNTIGGRRETRFNDGGRGGYERMNAPTREGTGYMSRSEFEAVSGMTDTNPYGDDGFFSRVFGIDPNKIDYTNNLGPRGIENVKRQAYDRFLNPFAQIDAFGRPTLGANAALGITRSGVQPGDLTVFGPAVQSQREGIAGLFENTPLGSLMPKQARIPGYDMNVLLPDLMGGPAVGGGTEPPGVPYFTSSTAPTRDAASVPESTFRPLFTTDPEERNFIEEDFEMDRRATDEDSPFSRPVPESTYRPIFTDDITVADVLAAEPMVTQQPNAVQPRLPTGPKVIQAIPGGDPGSASITVNPQSESPTYTAPDEPVDLLQDILAPDGSPLPGVMDVIGSPETGRTSSAAPIFNIPEGGFPDPRVSPPQLTPEQVQRANENNVATQRRLQLMAEGMSGDAAMMQAEREKIRARAARLGLGQ